jgi:hypothetical protein
MSEAMSSRYAGTTLRAILLFFNVTITLFHSKADSSYLLKSVIGLGTRWVVNPGGPGKTSLEIASLRMEVGSSNESHADIRNVPLHLILPPVKQNNLFHTPIILFKSAA